VYPIATSGSVWSSALAVLGAATQRGGAARRPRRLLDVAMDGEAAEEEEQERDRERAADVGAGEGRGARQRRTPWFVVIAAGRWQERAQPEVRSCEDGTVER